jgi:hypothetical protein
MTPTVRIDDFSFHTPNCISFLDDLLPARVLIFYICEDRLHTRQIDPDLTEFPQRGMAVANLTGYD